MGLKRTPLYETHRALGAKLVPFAGWEMPVIYSGVIAEHLNVRGSCGLFDVSHMGEIEICGKGAIEAVQRLTANDIEKAADGQCQYTFMCYPDGGVVDDLIVYRMSKERFFLCVNASNTDKVFEWMRKNTLADVRNVSAEYAQIALQGPASVEVLRPLSAKDPADIKYYHFAFTKVCGVAAIVSRTGYTGEDGFEIYLEPRAAVRLWEGLMESGKRYGIAPAGLGARDTLRLEMGYPLYGHELSEKTTPIEAGLKRFVALDKKADFIGKEALVRQASEGVGKTLIGFEMTDAGIPRQGYQALYNGKEAGSVTSGTLSPSLKIGIGMAYVEPHMKNQGTELEISIRSRRAKARVVRLPFYVKKAAASAQ